MRDIRAVASPDELPEWSEVDVAEILRVRGWEAFGDFHEPNSYLAAQTAGEPQLRFALLRFRGGLLKLTRGCYTGEDPRRFFVSVDFHDYRAAVLDPGIVRDAYRSFAELAQGFADTLTLPADIDFRCCPGQGTPFVALENSGCPPSDEGLRLFLVHYFGEGRVLNHLHCAFGEATIAFARTSVPLIVGVLAM